MLALFALNKIVSFISFLVLVFFKLNTYIAPSSHILVDNGVTIIGDGPSMPRTNKTNDSNPPPVVSFPSSSPNNNTPQPQQNSTANGTGGSGAVDKDATIDNIKNTVKGYINDNINNLTKDSDNSAQQSSFIGPVKKDNIPDQNQHYNVVEKVNNDIPPKETKDNSDKISKPDNITKSDNKIATRHTSQSNTQNIDTQTIKAITSSDDTPVRSYLKSITDKIKEKLFDDHKPEINSKEEGAIIARKVVKKSKKRREDLIPDPLVKDFINHKTQILPPNIAQKVYDKKNAHLPSVRFEHELDYLMFTYTKYPKDLNSLRLITSNAKDVDLRDQNGDTPLFYAVNNKNYEASQILLRHGANSNVVNSFGIYPIHIAAFKGSIDILHLLVSSGADINTKDATGKTPLMYASQAGHINTVIYLMEHGANILLTNNNGLRAINFAIANNNFFVVDYLVAHGDSVLIQKASSVNINIQPDNMKVDGYY